MKKYKITTNIFWVLINMVISFILFYILYLIGILNCFYNDDIFMGIANNSNPILEHNGGVLCAYMTRWFNWYLPLKLNIHPADFIMKEVAILKSVMSILTCLSIAKFSNLYIKSMKLFTITYLLVSIYIILEIFFNINIRLIWIFISNFIYFRYFLIFLFYSIFWFFIYKNILSPVNKKTNIFYLTIICFLGIIIATSLEVAIFSSLLQAVLIITYNIIIRTIQKLQGKDFYNKLKFNLNKNFYLPLSFLILGSIIYTTSAGFTRLVAQREFSFVNLNYNNIIEFSSIFIDKYILSIWYIWLIFTILLLIATIFAYKRKEITKIMLPVFMQISNLSVMYSLILCGKTHYSGNFWIMDNRLESFYYILILYGLIMLISYIGYIIKSGILYIFYYKITKICITLITIFLLFLFIYNVQYLYMHYSDIINKIPIISWYKEIKRDNYIAEKIMRFYYLKNETPILPEKLVSDDATISSILFRYNFKGEKVNCSTTYFMSKRYYPVIYKDNSSLEKGYCFSQNAFEKFYRSGGIITEDELQDIKFSKLLNDDFVLNITKLYYP